MLANKRQSLVDPSTDSVNSEEVSGLDLHTLEELMDSWHKIQRIPNYVSVAGELLFRKIFELAPAAVEMYSFAGSFATNNNNKNNEGEEESESKYDMEALFKSEKFVSHARNVVGTLDAALGMIGPDLEPLTTTLEALGARHVKYGVLPAHYDIVGQALLWTLETALARDWTPSVCNTWTLVFGLVSKSMMKGAANYLDERRRKLERRKKRKEAKRKKQERKDILNDHFKCVSFTPSTQGVNDEAPTAPATSSPTSSPTSTSTSTSTSAQVPPTHIHMDKQTTSIVKRSSIAKLPSVAAAARQNHRRSNTIKDTKLDQPLDYPTCTTTTTSNCHHIRDIVDAAIEVSSEAKPQSPRSSSRRKIRKGEKDDASCGTISTVASCESFAEPHYAQMIEEVYMSWDRIKAIPNYEEVAGVLLFKRIFQIAPVVKSVFYFTKGYENASEEEMEAVYYSPIFLYHAKSVVSMLDSAVHMLGPDLEPVSNTLKELGERHVSYGVQPEHYPVVGQALLETLEAALGEEHWTPQVREGWSGIFSFISTLMIAGAKESITRQKIAAAKQKKKQEISRRQSCPYPEKNVVVVNVL